MSNGPSGGRSSSGDRPPLAYGDLISDEFDAFESTASTLLGKHVFAGNQPDDFAIAGRAATAPEVLLLGTGFGGSIRSILTANPSARITAVDVSAEALELTAAIHRRYFPRATFDSVLADAATFTDVTSTVFDAICVDVYDEQGYPDFVTRPDFWRRVALARRSPESLVLTNAWGLPTHLGWDTNSRVQRAIGDAMSGALGAINYMTHRRNITFTTRLSAWGDHQELALGSGTEHEKADAIQLRLLRLRAATAPSFEARTELPVLEPEMRSLAHLDEVMASLWVPALKQLFDFAGDAFSAPRTVSTLVAQPEVLAATILSVEGDLRNFLPNVASNWIHQYGLMPRWFFDATANHYQALAELDLAWFVQGWLTQYVALLLKCPTGIEDIADLGAWVALGSEIVNEIERMNHL